MERQRQREKGKDTYLLPPKIRLINLPTPPRNLFTRLPGLFAVTPGEKKTGLVVASQNLMVCGS